MDAVTNHPSIAVLLDYWLHDSDGATTDAVDEHLMGCDACGQRLDELVALGDAVRDSFRAGAVAAMTSGAFVQRLAETGLRVRAYRVPHNGSVNCTVAPDDELLVSHLEAPLQGVELSTEPGVSHRFDDIPFDARVGEVLYVPRIAEVRSMPVHTLTITLLSVESGGTREVGRYTFHHRPWPGGR